MKLEILAGDDARDREDREKAPTLNPEKEEFWDHISERAAEIFMLGTRSNTIVEEIDELIDQLPED